MKYLFVLLLSAATPSISRAQDEIDTDRPDQTESPVTIHKKWFQLEHGLDMVRDNRISSYGSGTLLRYGLLNKLEVRLEADIIYSPSTQISAATTELQPVSLGTKVSLCEQKAWLPKTSLLVHVGIPSLAARSFKNLHAAPGIILTFQNDLSKIISWGYNAGLEWDGENTSPTYIYTFSNGINLSSRLYCFLEVFGSVSRIDVPQHNLDAGFSLLLNKNCKIDISSVAGLTPSAPDWSISIGASLRFNTSKK